MELLENKVVCQFNANFVQQGNNRQNETIYRRGRRRGEKPPRISQIRKCRRNSATNKIRIQMIIRQQFMQKTIK